MLHQNWIDVSEGKDINKSIIDKNLRFVIADTCVKFICRVWVKVKPKFDPENWFKWKKRVTIVSNAVLMWKSLKLMLKMEFLLNDTVDIFSPNNTNLKVLDEKKKRKKGSKFCVGYDLHWLGKNLWLSIFHK